jgi:3-oxoacyl-[acyl-carrier-protein] synthase-1
MFKKITSDVFVAGAGAITAIGNSVADCLAAFEQERAGMGHARYLETVHRQKIPVAEVKLGNNELAEMSGFSSGISRTALLSAVAAKEALDDTNIENMNGLRTGFISANTVGGMDKTEKFFSHFLSSTQKGKLRDVVNHECGSVTELVADKLGIRNYVSTISTACSSSANAIFFGARLIKNGILDVVVAGGADALTKFTLNGFNTLMILDEQYCKPFDENRKGLNLGEGAGYVVLVSDKVAEKLKVKPVCKLSGYCNRNDAYHQTASSPDGTGSYLAMKGALEKSGLQPGDIDYINLHGTGTQNNDLSEGIAIKRLFEPHYPKMSSTKSFTGHTLGASGGIEAVFSVLAIKHGIIYPNLRFTTQMAALPFAPETNFLKNVSVKHGLSNSFGFGGNCSSLIFSKL